MQSERSPRRQRRTYTEEFKANAVSACLQPGVSIASVALSLQLNTNLLRRWIVERDVRRVLTRSEEVTVASAAPPASPVGFIPLALPTASPRDESIRIELRRGETSMSVTWPLSAAAECAHWIHEWLR
jgi:transposase